jgi:hypothetical protein
MVQTEIRHNPMKPSRKTAIEAELRQVAMDAQKHLLIDIASVLGRPHKIHDQTQDRLVMPPHESGKRLLIAPWRRTDQRGFVLRDARFSRQGYGHRFPHRHNSMDEREIKA